VALVWQAVRAARHHLEACYQHRGATNAASGVSTSAALVILGGANGGAGAGGNIDNRVGGMRNYGVFSANPVGSNGGMTAFREGANFVNGSSSGVAASSPGSGGSGSAAAPSLGINTGGGSGAAGLVIVWEHS
jgi:hypothetical protein